MFNQYQAQLTHQQLLQQIENTLFAILNNNIDSVDNGQNHNILISAMQYTSLNNGKRIRPLLTCIFGILFNRNNNYNNNNRNNHNNSNNCNNSNHSGNNSNDNTHYEQQLDALMLVGSAIELIHCYSLIHDDLPSMDNDDFRRGKLSCHKQYGEAVAILTGDALQSLAFSILSGNELNLSSNIKLKIINLIANSAGMHGMVLGQIIDLQFANNWQNSNLKNSDTQNSSTQNINHHLSMPSDSCDAHNNDYAALTKAIEQMHLLKTGAIINAAIMAGYVANHEVINHNIYNKLELCANKIGLLFQIVDDILDYNGNAKIVGKTLHKDENNNKTTFVSILGLAHAQKYAKILFHDIYYQLCDTLNLDSNLFIGILDKLIVNNRNDNQQSNNINTTCINDVKVSIHDAIPKSSIIDNDTHHAPVMPTCLNIDTKDNAYNYSYLNLLFYILNNIYYRNK